MEFKIARATELNLCGISFWRRMGRGGRTSLKSKHAAAPEYDRDNFTYQLKYDVLADKALGYTSQQLKDKYSAKPGGKSLVAIRVLVHKWKKVEPLIAKMTGNVRTATMSGHREVGVATTLSASAEAVLVSWINDLRRDGVPVSGSMLALKAHETAAAHGIPAGGFTASNTWKASLLRPSRIFPNRAGQASPDAYVTIGQAFATEVKEWMAIHGTTRVYNTNQTGVNFEMLPKRTIDDREAATVWVKCGKREKQRATAMLLADSDGNKYDPFFVFKTNDSTVKEVQAENNAVSHGFSNSLWTEIRDLQNATGAQIYGNRSARWNEDITVVWLEYFFLDRTDRSEPVLILIYPFAGYWTEKVKAYAARLNVQLKSVLPKLTWRCQPADVAWIKPLKDCLRRKWVEHLRYQLAHRRNRTARFFMRPLDRGDVAEWLTEGWRAL